MRTRKEGSRTKAETETSKRRSKEEIRRDKDKNSGKISDKMKSRDEETK
jgi:hypothetical protein